MSGREFLRHLFVLVATVLAAEPLTAWSPTLGASSAFRVELIDVSKPLEPSSYVLVPPGRLRAGGFEVRVEGLLGKPKSCSSAVFRSGRHKVSARHRGRALILGFDGINVREQTCRESRGDDTLGCTDEEKKAVGTLLDGFLRDSRVLADLACLNLDAGRAQLSEAVEDSLVQTLEQAFRRAHGYSKDQRTIDLKAGMGLCLESVERFTSAGEPAVRQGASECTHVVQRGDGKLTFHPFFHRFQGFDIGKSVRVRTVASLIDLANPNSGRRFLRIFYPSAIRQWEASRVRAEAQGELDNAAACGVKGLEVACALAGCAPLSCLAGCAEKPTYVVREKLATASTFLIGVDTLADLECASTCGHANLKWFCGQGSGDPPCRCKSTAELTCYEFQESVPLPEIQVRVHGQVLPVPLGTTLFDILARQADLGGLADGKDPDQVARLLEGVELKRIWGGEPRRVEFVDCGFGALMLPLIHGDQLSW